MFEEIREVLGLENMAQEELRIERNRPTWNNIFLREAILWASRSHDPQTQHGCVLVRHCTVLSTGYNGFIGEIDDEALPNVRPFKYDFMIHAEHNAILNCARNGVSTVGATAYVTGDPCNNCFQYLWQAGISHIVYTNLKNTYMTDNDQHRRIRKALLLLMQDRMTIEFIPIEEVLR